MKKTIKRALALLLSVAVLCSVSITALAVDDVSLTATLNQSTLKVSDQPQSVTVSVETSAPIIIAGFGMDLYIPTGWSVSAITSEDPNINMTPAAYNLANGRIAWMTDDVEDTVVQKLAIYTVTVPANTPAGQYELRIGRVDASKTYGTVPVLTSATTCSTTLTIEDDSTPAPTTSYAVSASGSGSIAMGESANVTIAVSNTGETTYNAYYLTVAYNADVLRYTGINTDATVSNSSGVLTIAGYGADKTCGTDNIILSFTGVGVGTGNVTITGAKVDKSANAIQDAPAATIATAAATVTVTGYTVTLSDDFTGAATVDPGSGYTFTAKDTNYNYAVSATMGGSAVSVRDNGDGSFTIANVTGNLVITATKTAKIHSVTVAGTGAEDVTAASTATYGTDYTFTLSKNEGFDYTLAVTVNAAQYTPTLAVDGITYTIPGADVTGAIAINVTKTAKLPTTTEITFTGAGSGDVAGGTVQTANNGADFVFTLNEDPGFDYVVKLDGQTLVKNAQNQYVIPAASLTGTALTLSVEKTAKSDIVVAVSQYIQLNGKAMYLVTATGTVGEGKVLAYDGSAMFWSGAYNAYCYLVVSDQGLSAVQTLAADLVAQATATKVELAYGCDVNGTGRVDINDAQLTYDMYNAKYDSFTAVNIKSFLEADVNADKTVSTLDAAAIVNNISG